MNLFNEFKLRGELLIANPELNDPTFHRSVILITKHGSQGAVGFQLNKTTTLKVKEFWLKAMNSPCDCTSFVNSGGPVGGPLMALHNIPALAEYEVMPDVYFSSKTDQINALVQMGPEAEKNIRFYLGCSVWQGNQLETELDAGTWYVMEASQSDVFNCDSDLWTTVMRKQNSQFLLDLLKIPSHLIPKNILDN